MKNLLIVIGFLLLFISPPVFAKVEGTAMDWNILMKKVSGLQMPFIENQGQIKDKSVRFYANTFAGTLFITKDGQMVYSLQKIENSNNVKPPDIYSRAKHGNKNFNPQSEIQNLKSQVWVIKESLIGASISNVKGGEEAITRVNYFKGKDPSQWRKNISTYNFVSLGEVYKGIELKLKAYGSNAEKLFYVNPHVNPGSIKVKIEGADGLKINEKGELAIGTGLGIIKFTKPVAYQEINGKRVQVDVNYTLLNSKLRAPDSDLTYGFNLGDYDRTKELIIDPLLASTFIGGSDYDFAGVILESSGYVYMAGYTASLDFPTTGGAYNTTHNGYYDAFVSKLDGNLENLLVSTFLGGEYADLAGFMATDSSGNLCVTGMTGSPDFPTSTNAYDKTHNGNYDVFVSKLDSNLENLLASTLLGGFFKDGAQSITTDSSGNVFVTGISVFGRIPTTYGAYDTSPNGFDDAFVSKFDSNLENLLASTLLGGDWDEEAYSVSIDSSGNVYVAGYTYSSDFPTSTNAYDRTKDSYDGFVSKFDSNLQNLLASTFIGGSIVDKAYSVSIDSSGNLYVTGMTGSSDFPTSTDAYDITHNGNYDVFVSKLDSNLQNLLASTFIGGNSNEKAYYLSTDNSGNVYVTGYTQSSDFPTSTDAYDTTHNGNYDVFVSKLDNSLQNLLASTFIGGSSNEEAYSVFIGSSGNVYVTGYADWDFQTTLGAYNQSYNGGSYDAFVSKLDNNLSASYIKLAWQDWLPAKKIVCASPGKTVRFQGKIYNSTNSTTGQNVSLWTAGFSNMQPALEPDFIPQIPYGQSFDVRIAVNVPSNPDSYVYSGSINAMGDSTDPIKWPVTIDLPCTGGYLVLDGNDDYAETPDNSELDIGNESLTIEAWVLFNTFDSVEIISKPNAYKLYSSQYTSGSDKFRCLTFKLWRSDGDNSVSKCHTQISNSGFWIDGWHHMSGVYDRPSGEMRSYMDGALLNDSSIGQVVLNNSSDPLSIGVNLDGMIDEVRVSAEALYTGSSYTLPYTLLTCGGQIRALWHFDELEGSTLFNDACGNTNNIMVGYNGAHTEGVSLLGDINGDGVVDISDVILVLRIALGLDPMQPCSDINNDGIVDISDVILTLRMALGLDELKQCNG